jgi:hypothetical protein
MKKNKKCNCKSIERILRSKAQQRTLDYGQKLRPLNDESFQPKEF